MAYSALNRRNVDAGEHLQLLHSLGQEIERAMDAICGNRLDDFEDSVVNQRELSSRLESMTLRPAGEASLNCAVQDFDPLLSAKLRSASVSLQQLNRRYAILLSQSSEMVVLMSSLFRSYHGHLAQQSGTAPKHQTASWQV